MTKTQKKFFGCLGLGLVTAMTVVAASVPLPIASAITDNISIRVVDNNPSLSIEASVGQDTVTTTPNVIIDATFDSVERITISLDYTDANGEVHHFDDITNYPSDGLAGNTTFDISSDRGYGDYSYTITAHGYGTGEPVEKVVEFTYAPFIATAEQNKTDDGKTIDVTIGPFAPGVNAVEMWINGVLVGTVTEPGTYKYNPEDLGGSIYDDGTYDVVLKALHTETDGEGNPILDEHGKPVQTLIYRSHGMIVNFKALPNPDAGVPDTGGLFQSLNISKEDYLVTGLIVFFIIGVVAFGVVARNRKSSRTRK